MSRSMISKSVLAFWTIATFTFDMRRFSSAAWMQKGQIRLERRTGLRLETEGRGRGFVLEICGWRRPSHSKGFQRGEFSPGGNVAYRDLREFVRKLEKEGELKRIRAEIDPVLEITEVTQRIARDPMRAPNSVGPALLFERPKGSRVPLLVNTFGSARRMELAFEVGKLEEVADRIKGIVAMESPQGWFDKLKMLPKLAELGSFFPKNVKSGDCKEIVRKGADANLFDFPILKCWPQD